MRVIECQTSRTSTILHEFSSWVNAPSFSLLLSHWGKQYKGLLHWWVVPKKDCVHTPSACLAEQLKPSKEKDTASRCLQISAAEGLACLCHSQAAQTFHPAAESLQICPAPSPLLEGSMAKTAHFSETTIVVNWFTSFTGPKISSKEAKSWMNSSFSVLCVFLYFQRKKK